MKTFLLLPLIIFLASCYVVAPTPLPYTLASVQLTEFDNYGSIYNQCRAKYYSDDSYTYTCLYSPDTFMTSEFNIITYALQCPGPYYEYSRDISYGFSLDVIVNCE